MFDSMRRIVGTVVGILVLLSCLELASFAYHVDHFPVIRMERPEPGKLYINDKEFPSLRNRTIVIGPLTVKAIVDNCASCRVAFLIDNETLFIDSHPPYVYRMNERIYGTHVIEVRLYSSKWKLLDKDTLNVTFLNLIPKIFEFKGKLIGSVIDNSTGKKVEKANVTVVSVNYDDDPSNSTMINLTTGRIPLINKGMFRARVKPGMYMIHVSAPGYQDKMVYVNVRSLSKTRIKIALERLPVA